MAKFDWGFVIANKDTAQADCFVTICCTRTKTLAHFALSGHPKAAWGELIFSNMPNPRERDAEIALSTWGWI